ncbi:MAG: autotransporter-associated beta strand repeat-containing protein [Planctomycetia bacterium]
MGAGTLTLTGSNSFTGDTFVNAGTLVLDSTTAHDPPRERAARRPEREPEARDRHGARAGEAAERLAATKRERRASAHGDEAG